MASNENKRPVGESGESGESSAKVAKAVLDDTVLYEQVLTQNLATQVADVSSDEVDFNAAILMVIKYNYVKLDLKCFSLQFSKKNYYCFWTL